ncbi:hypothetical protein LZ575_20470 [Antarcticibacterium sp. 1MA-6-2]|uniref:hypothetical protein n=1 Tax=Antarcticibacterium sp. 1MA-6-2 TaxID=2908210 RepID=UPI001F22581F|nr:hypothetical protein [Antarcticibacterium sp. 1MA-6-2]UJH91017.1 hypothetical protein LZ575_20470 [Antarcticibacterium sp. 1MA-6-2]
MGNFKFSLLFTVLLTFLIINTEKANGQVYQEIDEFAEISRDFQEITGVQQDNLGNLWVSSNTQILKYNSSVSEVYNRFKGIPKEAGNINTIFIDSKNRIFAGSASGLLLFDHKEGKFSPIPSKNAAVQLKQ